MEKWLEDLKEMKCLNERDVKHLCDKAKEIFVEYMIYLSFSKKEEIFHIVAIFLWETLLIEVIIV